MRALPIVILLLAAEVHADPSGRRWKMESCTSSCSYASTSCQLYRCAPRFRLAATVGNTGATTVNGGMSYNDIKTIHRSAFFAWVGRTCSSGFTSWVVTDEGEFTSATNPVTYEDNKNNVIWLSGTKWVHMSNELAMTTTSYYVSDSWIFDADMEMNNNLSWSASPSASQYDPMTVIVHEAGHFAGLAHSGLGSAVMYAYVTSGSTKRSLAANDVNDICTVYPPVTIVPPTDAGVPDAGTFDAGTPGTPDSGIPGTPDAGTPTLPFGESCTSDAQCNAGLVCRGRPGSSSSICTASCPATCPTGYQCQAATSGQACLPQIGAVDHCKFCLSGSQCSTGVCLRLSSGQTYCGSSCTTSAECPAGNTCINNYCNPSSGSCTNQCTSNAQCGAGYTCTGGACVFNGQPGDDCTAAQQCSGCNVCVAQGTQAFCRSCCAGNGTGGRCDDCVNSGCTGSNTCIALSESPAASVCAPGGAAPLTCQPCATNDSCAEGLVCLAGTCRQPCTAAAPGSACPACFTYNGGTAGACACPAELNTEGQPCGEVGLNQLAACQAGLVCVFSTSGNACRTLCDATQPGSCGAGYVCQLLSGVGVCLPGTAGTLCSSCSNSGACNGNLTCYANGCYTPCNVYNPTCSTCVQTAADGSGVCACSTQISNEGETCGLTPELRACATGLRCVNATCQTQCTPGFTTCERGSTCVDVGGGEFYCVNSGSGGGGGPTGGGGGSPSTGGGGGRRGGGTGGGGTTDLGCGCATPGGHLGALALGALWLLRRREGRAR